jgi:hypothetical protein
MSGATVSGAWSGGYSGSDQCITGGDGSCTITTGDIRRKDANVSFTVNDVTLSTFQYEPVLNHDPDGDSNGTTITIAKP